MGKMIEALKLKHKYERHDEEGHVTESIMALDGIDLTVEEGQFISILGHNGCGKSTLAKHLNALVDSLRRFPLGWRSGCGTAGKYNGDPSAGGNGIPESG